MGTCKSDAITKTNKKGDKKNRLFARAEDEKGKCRSANKGDFGHVMYNAQKAILSGGTTSAPSTIKGGRHPLDGRAPPFFWTAFFFMI